MNAYDLRSDTVTQPSPAMREAMAKASVGDDVYGEDPTVNRLEAMTAEMLGKEAGLFVPSGTMGNLICQLVHCGRGDEVIIGDLAHTFLYEAGGSAVVGAIHPHTVRTNPDGTLPLLAVREAVRADNVHFPRTRLLILENTHNRTGGLILPLSYISEARALCDEVGIAFHCDGARLWNAAIGLAVPPIEIASYFDSLSVCLSKGLAAPVGSVIVGSQAFVKQAQRIRKLLGGGMRQAGILAAAGIIALTDMQERLALDHDNAKYLAQGLEERGYRVTHPVQSNIVIFEQATDIPSPAERAAAWKKEGLLISPISGQRFRAVTHYGIERANIEEALQIIEHEREQNYE